MKLKTRKSVSKRIKVTGTKKIRIRSGGQGHFNSREPGSVTTNKRRDKTLSHVMRNHIREAMPWDATRSEKNPVKKVAAKAA